MIGNANDETNLPHKLVLTDTQVSKLCNAFANGSSADITFPKSQLPKMQSGVGFSPETKTGISGAEEYTNFPFKMKKYRY